MEAFGISIQLDPLAAAARPRQVSSFVVQRFRPREPALVGLALLVLPLQFAAPLLHRRQCPPSLRRNFLIRRRPHEVVFRGFVVLVGLRQREVVEVDQRDLGAGISGAPWLRWARAFC
jgi:hypothetical protein